MLLVRQEQVGDTAAIHDVLAQAFPTDAEARLVAALREAGELTISLVAEVENQIAGHVALSPVRLEGTTSGLGLAPVAVSPRLQRQGIGKQLIEQGLQIAQQSGFGFVVVLGEPAYYRRFGFAAASQWNLRDEYQGGDAFQAIEFSAGTIPSAGGLVRYANAFRIFAE